MLDAYEFMSSLLNDPAVRAEYERQKPQFELHKEFLRARNSVTGTTAKKQRKGRHTTNPSLSRGVQVSMF